MHPSRPNGPPSSGPGDTHNFTREYAASLDSHDPLRQIRNEFLIPSKANLKSETLLQQGAKEDDSRDPCIYLCGNSLGLQPRRTSERIQQYLSTWATQGVFGHFKPLSDSPLPTWLHVDDEASKKIAPIVGAKPSEVSVMETLTANLHFLMSAFYHPDPNGRHKIIIESKAFPSDHYAVESQIRHHSLSPSTSMITIEPPNPTKPILSTSQILSVIDQHAPTTALILLPGVHFYTGQLLDIPRITAHAHSHNIFTIWDLAHAVGNVPLQLHAWDCDAAAWCSYKYLNAGPGAIGGLFVHERNSQVPVEGARTQREGDLPAQLFRNRLSGWWGSNKASRFAMTNQFEPIPGAAGFQLSNPSVLDMTSLCASLDVFAMTDMASLRAKSLKLTGYLEALLLHLISTSSRHGHGAGNGNGNGKENSTGSDFSVITPKDPAQRGSQLSLKLRDGILDTVMEELERKAVVVDERRPDVIRVAPVPLYNTFMDVYEFVQIFREALEVARAGKVYAERKAGAGGTHKLMQTI